MVSSSKSVVLIQAIAALTVLQVASRITSAEKLPIKSYTTADGLAHNNVSRIVRDSRGFLWFCTFEGLSRFDGYTFTTYGVNHGLPSQVVNDLLETREGQYWIATDAGLCLFNPKGIPHSQPNQAKDGASADFMFTSYLPGEDIKSKQITSLLQDRRGAVWCGTAKGLYRVEQQEGRVEFRFMDLGMPASYGEGRNVIVMTEDRLGSLWIGSMNGIYRLLPDGRVQYYGECHGVPLGSVLSLLADREGRIWTGTQYLALCCLVSGSDPTQSFSVRDYSTEEGLPHAIIHQVFQASDGSLWAGCAVGLIRFTPSADGFDFRFRVYGQPHGLSSENVQAIAEDRGRNLWIGMTSGGAAKLAHSGIIAFGEPDGFKGARAIFRDKAEGLDVITLSGDKEYSINRFDGERFTTVSLNFPKPTYFGWGSNGLVLEDRAGEWWVATGSGLFRFPKVKIFEELARTPPRNVYTTRDGLASNDLLRVFEDSSGAIWVATANGGGLSRWDRSSETFHQFTEKDGLPSLLNFYPISLAEDHAGSVWVGFSFGGGLVRYRNRHFTRFTSDDGLPSGGIFNLFVDSSDRLWVPTTRGGVCRIDHPDAERPSFATYTTADGLSSDDVKAITEDRWGRIYLGTGRGIDRIDPATGHVRHYTANEGALLGDVQAALQDRDGALWFSYGTGLVRLVPEPDPQTPAPQVLITALRIAGEPRPLSALGEAEVAPFELLANKNDLQIEFVALGFGPGEGLRYQYLLDGANQEWSPASDQPKVTFANLAPGRYRFMVRAINAEGVASETPASFSFRILPPLWQRWWFISIIVFLAAGVAYRLYRYRVGRLLEIERIRTRIAADLHDDIGSSLSQIAVLSEVLRKQLGSQEARIANNISLISRVTQEALDSMSDIVWAINPRRDHLNDLIRRMRRVVSETLPARNIEFAFDVPAEGLDLKLGADVRREVFLMFKEAINNLVRHSGCKRAEIELKVDRALLKLKVADDGLGFDPESISDGNGLSSLGRRARALGGETVVSSRKGSGTTINVTIPYSLHARARISGSRSNGSGDNGRSTQAPSG